MSLSSEVGEKVAYKTIYYASLGWQQYQNISRDFIQSGFDLANLLRDLQGQLHKLQKLLNSLNFT